MIKIIKVTKHIDEKKILDSVSLELPDTGFIALSGEETPWAPSILNMLAGIDSPTEGSIIVDNIVLTHKNSRELADYRNRNIAFIRSEANLIEDLTVEENLGFIDDTEEYENVIRSFNLKKILDKKTNALSKEEEYRVTLARTVLKNPRIILAEEISDKLSRESKTATLKLLKSLSKKRLVILVSKDDYEVDEYIDMLVVFEGNIISKTNKFKNDFSKNEIKTNKSIFPMNLFLKKSIEIFRYRILLMTLFGILAIFSILITSSLNRIDLIREHIKIITSNDDVSLVFKTPKNLYDDDILKMIESNKITDESLEIGRSVGGIDNSYSKFTFGKYDEKTNGIYYKDPVEMYSYFDKEVINNIDYGRMPTEASEIVINSYIADLIVELGIIDEYGDLYKPSSYEELVSSTRAIKLGNKSVVITGIKKVNLNDFEKLKKLKSENKTELFKEMIKNIGSNIYVPPDFFNLFKVDNECNPKYIFKYTESEAIIPIERRQTFKNTIVLEDDTLMRELNKGEIIIGKDDIKHFGIYAETAIGSKITLFILDETIGETYTLELTVKGISKDGNIYFNREDLRTYYWDGIGINKVVVYEKDENSIKDLLSNNKAAVFRVETPYSSKFTSLENQVELLKNITKISLVIFAIGSLILLTWTYIGMLNKFKDTVKILKWFGIKNEKLALSTIILFVLCNIISIILGLCLFLLCKGLIDWFLTSVLLYKPAIISIKILDIILILVVMASLDIVLYHIILKFINKIKI